MIPPPSKRRLPESRNRQAPRTASVEHTEVAENREYGPVPPPVTHGRRRRAFLCAVRRGSREP